MPITENGFEYTMPLEYKEIITKAFLQTLKYELKVVFKNGCNYQDDESWYFADGTYGWQDAFTKAAKLHKLDQLVEYYDSLPWYDSDMFDGEIEDLALFYNVIDVTPPWTRLQILRERTREKWILRDYYFEKLIDWAKHIFKKKKIKNTDESGWTVDKW